MSGPKSRPSSPFHWRRVLAVTSEIRKVFCGSGEASAPKEPSGSRRERSTRSASGKAGPPRRSGWACARAIQARS